MNTIAANISKEFQESFASTPRLFYSPGRINLIGEHVDYNDGFVMPAAIDKGVYYAVAANNTDEIHFYASDFKEWFSTTINDIKKGTSWQNYVLSVVNEFLLAKKKISGFNCVFSGDIPRGSGMSSSAAVEGGLAFALNEIFDTGFSRQELAKLCQRAEHNFPNVKCGIMDQYANMLGKEGHVLLLDCKSFEHQYFPLQLEGYKIILINSKVQHSLVSGEYNLRRQYSEGGLRILKEKLGVQSFRDIASVSYFADLKSAMTTEEYDCSQYVVEEIARTKKAAELLQQNNLIEFGQLMYATHEGLSKLYKVSCVEIDFLVALAATNPNVLGARMMGGGFGGCSINIVTVEAADDFIATSLAAYQQKFGIEAEAYQMTTSDGTYEIIAD